MVAYTSGLKWPAGLSGTQPGPTMWPGWTIVTGSPCRRACRSRYASTSALAMPYSPNGFFTASSTVGTATECPWVQTVPMCTRRSISSATASTSWRALARVKQIRSITMSPPSAAISAPKRSSASSELRSSRRRSTCCQAGSSRYGDASPRLTATTSWPARTSRGTR